MGGISSLKYNQSCVSIEWQDGNTNILLPIFRDLNADLPRFAACFVFS